MASFWLDESTSIRYTVGRPFSYDGINYTSAGATPETFSSLKFVEVICDPRPDDTYYWVTGPDDKGHYTSQPRDLATLQVNFENQSRLQEHNLLGQTDWMIAREAETGTPIPPAYETWRNDIRAVGDANRTKIAGTTSVSELEALMKAPAEVPVDPDDPDAGMQPNPDPHLDPWPVSPAEAENEIRVEARRLALKK